MPDDPSTIDIPPETPRPSVQVRVRFGATTHPGKVRPNNEDHFLVAKLAKALHVLETSMPHEGDVRESDEEGYLMAVADGMGGVAGGERASALAVESVEQFSLDTLKWFLHMAGQEENELFRELRAALERADRTIFEESSAQPRLTGMGTTLTMAYSVGTDLYVVHAGDSRAYLLRAGELRQITTDHTLVQVLVQSGLISPEDARHHKRRNVVTNIVGGPRPGVDGEIHKLSIRDGDILLLCTDGLTDSLSDAEIVDCLSTRPDPQEACECLLEEALDRGAPDNVTAIVARYEQPGR